MLMRSGKLLAFVLVLSVAACGGGDGSSDGNGMGSTMTVSITTGTGMPAGTTTYTEGPINSHGYYDPSFSADSATGVGTLITMCSGVTGGGNPCNVLINVRTAGWTPGGNIITGGTATAETYVLYMKQGAYYDSIASRGTITLSSVGNVGEPIAGSFQADLGLRTNMSTTIGISGTFSVIRYH